MTEPPTEETPPRAPGVVYAPLPVSGNSEILVYLTVVAVLAVTWAASGAVDAQDFTIALSLVTVGYLVSRGIAKAGRVGEDR